MKPIFQTYLIYCTVFLLNGCNYFQIKETSHKEESCNLVGNADCNGGASCRISCSCPDSPNSSCLNGYPSCSCEDKNGNTTKPANIEITMTAEQLAFSEKYIKIISQVNSEAGKSIHLSIQAMVNAIKDKKNDVYYAEYAQYQSAVAKLTKAEINLIQKAFKAENIDFEIVR